MSDLDFIPQVSWFVEVQEKNALLMSTLIPKTKFTNLHKMCNRKVCDGFK